MQVFFFLNIILMPEAYEKLLKAEMTVCTVFYFTCNLQF